MPSENELVSIIDQARKERQLVTKIDEEAFPGMSDRPLLWYWSSSPVGSCIDDRREGCGFYVDFGNSGADDVFPWPRYKPLAVRLVKKAPADTAIEVGPEGESSSVSGHYVLNGGEAKDFLTGFVWRRCSEGQTFSAKLGCIGLLRSVSMSELLHLRVVGWRVPTVEEMLTLMDPVRKAAGHAPYINVDAFPDMLPTSPGEYLTATPYGDAVWCVDFHLGVSTGPCGKYPLPVRLIHVTP